MLFLYLQKKMIKSQEVINAFLETEKENNKKFREYLNYDWKDELYMISNVFLEYKELWDNDDTMILTSKVLKNIVYDKEWNIFDTIYSWNIQILVDAILELDENKEDESLEIQKLEEFIDEYWKTYYEKLINSSNYYHIKDEYFHVYTLKDILFKEKEEIKDYYYCTIIGSNLIDYKLLPKEVLNRTDSYSLEWLFSFNSVYSITDESDWYQEINIWNDLREKNQKILEQFWDEEEENEEKEEALENKIFSEMLANFSVKLQIWTEEALKRRWMEEEFIKYNIEKNDLTDNNTLYWIFTLYIPQNYMKLHWEITKWILWYQYFLSYVIFFSKWKDTLKEKINEIFDEFWVDYDKIYSLVFQKDWWLKEKKWFYFSKFK